MWSVREVVFAGEFEDEVLAGPVYVPGGKRYETRQDPKKWDSLDVDSVLLCQGESSSSHVFSPNRDARRRVKEDPDEICGADETNDCCETHQKIDPFLDLQQYGQDR